MATACIHMATDMPRPSVRPLQPIRVIPRINAQQLLPFDAVHRCYCLIIPEPEPSIGHISHRHPRLYQSDTRRSSVSPLLSIVHYLSTLPSRPLPAYLPTHRRLTYFASTCPLLARSRSLPRARPALRAAPPASCPKRRPTLGPPLYYQKIHHHQSSPWPPQLTLRRLSTLPVDAKAALKALLSALLPPRDINQLPTLTSTPSLTTRPPLSLATQEKSPTHSSISPTPTSSTATTSSSPTTPTHLVSSSLPSPLSTTSRISASPTTPPCRVLP